MLQVWKQLHCLKMCEVELIFTFLLQVICSFSFEYNFEFRDNMTFRNGQLFLFYVARFQLFYFLHLRNRNNMLEFHNILHLTQIVISSIRRQNTSEQRNITQRTWNA